MAQSSGGARRSVPQTAMHNASHHLDAMNVPLNWYDKQEVIQRELEETRSRAAQMEKTMRWWSDCTANWREKWSKVRSERNKAREEIRVLRQRLEASQREVRHLMHERGGAGLPILEGISNGHELQEFPERDESRPESSAQSDPNENMIPPLYSDPSANGALSLVIGTPPLGANRHIGVENVSVYAHKSAMDNGRFGNVELHDDSIPERDGRESRRGASAKGDKGRVSDLREVDIGKGGETVFEYFPLDNCQVASEDAMVKTTAQSEPSSDLSELSASEETIDWGLAHLVPPVAGAKGHSNGNPSIASDWSSVIDDSGVSLDHESLEQQMMLFKLRLEEAAKTVQLERNEKTVLSHEVSRLQAEVSELRSRFEDARAGRQEALRELISLQSQHQKDVQSLQMEMLDDASSRDCTDKRLSDLRCELERLQEENASEWGRRERLESEKLGLEREVKKLKARVADLEERLEKRVRVAAAATADADLGQLRQEVADRTKELVDLKHSHSKLKKVLSEKSIELQHSTRRGDQYESEVKRLRVRVDELKKELAVAEDDVDGAANNLRKLQRSNDGLQETVESLQVQVDHLQSRLRAVQQPTLFPALRSTDFLDSGSNQSQF